MKTDKMIFLKKTYFKNPVLQFLVSYLVVLIVPICIMLIALHYTFSFVLDNVMSSNLTVLNNSRQLVDLKIDSIQTLAGHMVCDDNLQILAAKERIDQSDNPELLKALKSLTDIVDARSIDLLDSAYVVLRKPECVLYKRGIYTADSFSPYILRYGLNLSVWHTLYLNYKKQLPLFSPTQSSFDYIVPFGVAKDGGNYGVVVCDVSRDIMNQMLGFSSEYGTYSFFLLGENNTILFSEDYLSCKSLIGDMNLAGTQGMHSKKNRWVIYTKSEKYGWTYVLIVSSEQLLKRFNHLRLILILLMMAAVAIGLCVASAMAMKNGKPLNEIFNSIQSQYPETAVRDMTSLEKLFKALAADRPEGLFYPALLSDLLCSNIRSDNFDVVKSILLMVEKENFGNRVTDEQHFIELNSCICSTLKSLDICLPEDDVYYSKLTELAENSADYELYFDELSEFCKLLCSNAGMKKTAQRKNLAENIRQYLDDNYMNPSMSLTVVADKFNVSESYVSMIYKEQTGINFTDYMEKLRIDHAVEMLKNPELSIEVIAGSSGYSSATSFRRAFKRVTGKTPSEYK